MSIIFGPGVGLPPVNSPPDTLTDNTLADRNPVVFQAVPGQTGNQTEWRDPSGAVLAYVDVNGAIGGGGALPGAVILAPATSTRNVIQPTANAVALTLRAFAGQTQPQQRWQSSAGVTQLSVLANGADLSFDAAAGCKLGAAGQKAGLLGATPVLQQAQTVDLKQVMVGFGLMAAAAGATPLNLGGGPVTAGASFFDAGSLNVALRDASSVVFGALGRDGSTGGVLLQATTGDLLMEAGGSAGDVVLFATAAGKAVRVQSQAAGNVVLQTEGFAGQTGDLQRWTTAAAASTLAKMTAAGGLVATSLTTGANFAALATGEIDAAGSAGTAGQVLTSAGAGASAAWAGVPVGGVLALCAGFTPAGTGADVAEFVVPYSPRDGTTAVTWNVVRIDFRVQTAGGAPAVTVEKSTAAGVFSAATVGTVTLGSGASEGSVTAALGTVASGNKLRFNVGTLATAQNWTVEVTLGASI